MIQPDAHRADTHTTTRSLTLTVHTEDIMRNARTLPALDTLTDGAAAALDMLDALDVSCADGGQAHDAWCRTGLLPCVPVTWTADDVPTFGNLTCENPFA